MKSLHTLLSEVRHALHTVSDSPAYESQRLLAHHLKKPLAWLLTWPEFVIEPALEQAILADVLARQQGQPLAYLLGEWDFFGRTFTVTPDTLIPRADTETLIEQVLARFRPEAVLNALDLGTGSGCIAITLALELPGCTMQALDWSEAALKVATANAQALGARVGFVQSDWFEALEGQETGFDLVVSNPPYIEAGDPHLADLIFEPRTALVAQERGLKDLRHIADNARRFLKPGGWLLMEHGYDQGPVCMELLTRLGYTKIEDWLDYGGQPRIIIGQWNHAHDDV